MKKNGQNNFTLIDFSVIAVIFLLALLFRLYKLNTPLADFHSFRQVDTASVARTFVDKGFDLLKPTYHDLSNVQSGKENIQGYRMVEFPLYNAAFAFLYKYIPILSLEIYGRLISTASSLVVICIMYYFLLKERDRYAAIISSLIFSIFPFFVFFSRTVLPEMTALALTYAGLYSLYKYNPSGRKLQRIANYTLSSVFFALGLLIKPTVIFYVFAFAYLFIIKHKWSFAKKISVYLFFIISIVPLVLWRQHILKYPEGIPYSEWLYGMVNTSGGWQNIFLRPAFFRWIFFERINNIILGGYVTAFFILGLFVKSKRYFIHSLLISSFIYLFVFQGGNVQHEYYQILILPSLAMFSGVGASTLIQNKKLFINNYLTAAGILVVFLFSFFISYYRVKDYYNVSYDLVNMSKVIRDLTQKEDKIITETLGDTTLLYLSERRGSPHLYKNIEEFKKDGYSYLVTLDKKRIQKITEEKTYEVVFENEKFALIRL